jgi:hypothetical protein
MYQQQQYTLEESDFVRSENKARLWKLLQNNGAFNGINNSFFSSVRGEFETTIQETEEKNKGKTTMQKCKLFIDAMVEKMKRYKYLPSPDIHTTSISGIPNASNEPPYTSESIKKSRMDAFDNALSKKQEEFNLLNAKQAPPTVDFSDKETDTEGDVNKLLEKAMRERENFEHHTPKPVSSNTKNTSETSVMEPIKTLSYENSKDTSDKNINEERNILAMILKKLETIEMMIREEKVKKN